MKVKPSYTQKLASAFECGVETSFLHLCSIARAETNPTERKRKYKDALALAKLVKQDSTPEVLIEVAECYYSQCLYVNALEVLSRGARNGWSFADHSELRGRCLFKLEEYEMAISAFREATELGGNPRTNKVWIMRCQARYSMKNERSGPSVIVMDSLPNYPELTHEWYQTSTHVSLLVYVAGLTDNQVKAEFTDKSVDVVVDGKEPTRLHFDLEKEINPADTRVTVGSTKIEVRMAKAAPGKQFWKFDA